MDEQLKQRVLMAVLAFNLIIIAYQILFNSGLVFGDAFSWGRLAIGLLIAVAGAGVAYVVVQKTQS